MRKPIFVNEHGSWAMIFVPFISTLLFNKYFESSLIHFLTAILFFFFAYRPWEMYFKASSLKKPQPQIEHALTWFYLYISLGIVFGMITLIIYKDLRLIGFASASLLFFILGQLAINRYKNAFLRDVFSILGITVISAATDFIIHKTVRNEQFMLWGLNAAFFLSSAFYVHMKMLSINKNSDSIKKNAFLIKRKTNLVYQFLLLSILSVLYILGHLSTPITFSVIPIIFHSIVGSFVFPSKTNFKRIGLIFSFYSLLFCFLLSF